MARELTERQREVYDFLVTSWKTHGFPPSIREVASHFGFKSTRAVVDHLNALERKDHIIRGRERSRAIEFPLESGHGLDVIELPVVGRVAAGEPILAVENIVETVALDRSWVKGKNPFLLKVVGDSMRDKGILEDDYVMVSKEDNANNGDVVVALVDDDATVKTFKRTSSGVTLQPENEAYTPIEVTADNDFRIVGKVVGLYRKM